MVEGDSDVVLAADDGVPSQGLRCTGVQLECNTLERERDMFTYTHVGVKKGRREGEEERKEMWEARDQKMRKGLD